MRLAFADLLFSWPPHGGADVDVYNTLCALQTAGHEVRLFVTHLEGSWERGACTPDALPFPCTRMDFSPASFTGRAVIARMRDAVDAWQPEAVFVCDAFFLKAALVHALAHYPLALRLYAHELLCQRDILRFREGAPCPNDYLHTPETCRRCALEHLGPRLRAGHADAWLDEYRVARAYAPEYHRQAVSAVAQARIALVYNEGLAALLREYCATQVLPGAVNAGLFAATPPPIREQGDKKIILMTGRAEDPLKGLAILRAAGEKLAAQRRDFQIWATMPEDAPQCRWFRAIGWRAHDTLPSLYAACDLAVAPSVWDEPFGMTAVEAMACGRPVIAARVGGLKECVVHGETGLLFDRGDAEELAAALARLLDDAGLRTRMGAAGRARVEAMYTWPRLVERHYPAILARLRGGRTEDGAA